jgi:hydrogenase nickel incorporation protein HypA/HybF
MHEVSIAETLIEVAVENCLKQGGKRIDSIRVQVGRATGIMPDALLFAFDAIKIGTIAEKATLTIDEIPVSGTCLNCNKKFEVDEAYVITCPNCGSLSIQIETGRELNIYEMEVN